MKMENVVKLQIPLHQIMNLNKKRWRRCCVLKIYMARVIHVYVSTIDGVPTIDFDLDLLHTRYALMLWHYGPRKEEEKAQSDDEAPMRHLRDIGITEDIKVHDI
ncbi:hypothetical protein FXO37_05130 [Capsicum annuum]|nr:hypothetical protein FXO37_05130 [Capsicum annuum]